MTFTEIAHRLTGISSPFFGVSWVPPEADVTIAQRVLVFLEDRRVLFAPRRWRRRTTASSPCSRSARS